MEEYNIAQRAYNIAEGSLGLCLTLPIAGAAYLFFKADEIRSGSDLYSPFAQAAATTGCFDALCMLKIAEGIAGHRIRFQ